MITLRATEVLWLKSVRGLVPAKMTKRLQPADVALFIDLFSRLKACFRATWSEEESLSQGTVSQE